MNPINLANKLTLFNKCHLFVPNIFGCSHFHCYRKQKAFPVDIFNRGRRLFFKNSLFRKSKYGQYSVISKPGEVTHGLKVPEQINKPPYFESGLPPTPPRSPEIKTAEQISKMRESCQIARKVLDSIGEILQVGMTHENIDSFAHNKIIELGAYPSPLNYHGFPKSICTSVNNVACHGIPDNRQLEDGDIISIDITVFYNGYHGDCCETYFIGEVDVKGVHLVNTSRKCRDSAVSICRPGVHFNKIAEEANRVAKQENLTVVSAFNGHGIGAYFHGPPDIYHCINEYPGVMLPGMTFTIEPVIAQGKEDIVVLEDGWTAVTLDNGRAAQFEHTILITENSHEILT